MRKELEFIKACDNFYVLTINGDFPAGRPFGAIMEHENDLYITTADNKPVYEQITAHPQIQLLAQKPGTRSWLRVCGIAEECHDIAVKQKMLDECPNLAKFHSAPDEEHFNVFWVQVLSSEIN